MVKTVIVNDSGKLAEVVQFEVPTEDPILFFQQKIKVSENES